MTNFSARFRRTALFRRGGGQVSHPGPRPRSTAGTTTEAAMSSSVWTLAAAAKSWRTLNVRHPLSLGDPDAEVGPDDPAALDLELVPGACR